MVCENALNYFRKIYVLDNIKKKNKEKIQKKSHEIYQNLSKERKTENKNMVVNDVKISRKIETKASL